MRGSLNEPLPAVLGALPPAMKLLTAAFRAYSSSISRLRLWRMNNHTPPATAAIKAKPTTSPPAIAALLVPDFDDELELEDVEASAEAVIVVTCPEMVTTDGVAEVVEEEDLVLPAADDVVVAEADEADATVPDPVSQTE